MNKITSGDFSSSFITAFIRSSNWPRYLVPATNDAKSKVTIRLLNKTRETFLCTILRASPSAIADFPTPGSPIKIGLFFLRRERICETRSISFSRPTIGSSRPSSAAFVRSRPKLSRTGVFDFESVPFLLVIPVVPSSSFAYGSSSDGLEGASERKFDLITSNSSFTIS